MGLIDYGQTRRLSDAERLGIARVVAALGQESGSHVIAKAMRDLGFRTEWEQDDATMVKYARLCFDCEQEGKDVGFATPQHYFTFLMQHNRLTDIPDAASKCDPRVLWTETTLVSHCSLTFTLYFTLYSLCGSRQFSISRNGACYWKRSNTNFKTVVAICPSSTC